MRSKSTRNLVLNAVFAALILLLGLTPIGLIPLGTINVTIMHIPVIIGALFLGWQSGLLFGFIFGVCSFMSAYGLSLTPPSGLASALGASSPLYLFLMCMIPRLLVPLAAYGVNTLLNRLKIQRHLAMSVSGLVGSLTNSIFYLGLMAIFYRLSGLDLNRLMTAFGIEKLNLWSLIGVIFAGAGILEAIAAFIIVPAIVEALNKVQKQTGGSKAK